MTAPNFQGKTGWIRQFVAAVQAAANAVIDATVGSVTLAWGQGVTGVALWLQAQIATVLLLTRAATSFGTDLDSFFADFDFTRLPAKAASDVATFARATPTLQAVVLVGAGITTGPGGILFNVGLDTSNAAYNAGLGGYVLAPSITSITVPIICATAGTVGNVLANTATSFLQPIPGVDTVTNPNNITNGLNAESDPSFRARFPVYLASLATANADAIDNAIQNVQQGIQWIKIENYDYPGVTPDNGNFFVLVDDGTGSPPDSLVTAVQTAINAIRGFTIRFSVNKPTVVAPAVALTIRVAAGFTASVVKANVQAAIATAVNAVPMDALTLFISQVEQAALTVAGCMAVQPGETTINSSAADYALTLVQEPRITSSAVTVGTY